jgi:hypothetical protein
MWTNFWPVFFEFKWLVLCTLCVGLFLGITGLLLCRNLRWDQKRLKFLGIFLNLRTRDNLFLCVALLRCLFVMSAVAFCVEMDTAQLCFFLVLCVLYNLLHFRPVTFLFDLFNNTIICAALLAGNILIGFLHEVSFDWRTITVYVLLAFFITVYVAFFFLRDVARIVQSKPERKVLQ